MKPTPIIVLGLFAICPACTDGPAVAGEWKTTSAWGDGNCNQDFTWFTTVNVEMWNADGQRLGGDRYSCDDGGFELAVPGGSSDLLVEIAPIWHQDQTATSNPHQYAVIGPIHDRNDLGRVDLTFLRSPK